MIYKLLSVFVLLYPLQVIAFLNDGERASIRGRIVEYGVEAVFKQYKSKCYLFQIMERNANIDILVLLGNETNPSEAEVFLGESFEGRQFRVAWTKLEFFDLSRLLYVLDQSDALSLGKRVYEDPFAVTVFGEKTRYRLSVRRENKSIVVERERDDSMPMDYLFRFINGLIVKRLGTRSH